MKKDLITTDFLKSIPVVIDAGIGTSYGFGDTAGVLPAAFGHIPGVDEQDLEMDAFLLVGKKLKAGEELYGIPDGYYRVRDEEGGDPWFIFVLRELAPQKMQPIAEREAQLLDIHRFIKTQFKTISYGNAKAAQEILKYCKIKI